MEINTGMVIDSGTVLNSAENRKQKQDVVLEYSPPKSRRQSPTKTFDDKTPPKHVKRTRKPPQY